ncbi:MAG: hypothetical protein NC548_60005 [Lachnospiraceae bacterium]|nr:hypothetical protein [Lachnospiraceae bacterium]
MMVLGYAKDYYYAGDSSLQIRVRIPSIHGPYRQQDAGGKTIRNYVEDADLPYYQSILLPRNPRDGDVVVLSSMNNSESKPDFLVIGLTGSSYTSGSSI